MWKKTQLCSSRLERILKKLYKLISNACFGKTTENLRKRWKLPKVSNLQQAETSAQWANFKSFQFIQQDLILVFFKNSPSVWTKLILLNTSILNFSKVSFYKNHYERMVTRYSSDQLKNVNKDTDSLLYQRKTPDLHEDLPFLSACLTSPTIQRRTIRTIQILKKCR